MDDPIIVNVSRKEGGINNRTEGTINVSPASDENFTYTFENGQFRLTSIKNTATFTNKIYTFTWVVDGVEIGTPKTFSLSTVNSLVDYEFKFDQTVFNSSRGAGTYSFRVLKKDNTGTTELTASNTEVGVYLNGSSTKLSSWVGYYGLDDTDKRTYVLKDAANTIWDTETVELINDGEIEEIVTDETQITATYDDSGNLVYTPSSLNVEVNRIVG
jgi:hypothetical protein